MRVWQKSALLFLLVLTVLEGLLGMYALHTSPALSFASGFWFSLSEPEMHRLDALDLDPTVSLRLPEFFSPSAEAAWWRMQEQIYRLLQARDTIPVSFIDQEGNLRTEAAHVGGLPWMVVFKRTWLIYLVVGICLSSALAVFRRHRSAPGTSLAFFLLMCALYFSSSAPLVSRSLTLSPFAFKLLTRALYIAASGLPIFAHFALVFPKPKEILDRRPWIVYLPYGSFVFTLTLYMSGIGAFGTTFPLVGAWLVVIVWAFLHSLLKESDPFLQRQIRLSLVAPVLVSLFFVCLYVLPGVLRLPAVDFHYFALFFLLLPFALPLALDNLALYHARLEAEHLAQQEKEHLRADLHDLILNNLAVISRTSEVARTQLGGERGEVRKRLQAVQDLATSTSRHLREFLWVLDEGHSNWDVLCSQLRQWGHQIMEDAGCEFELEVTPAVLALPPPAVRLRICLDRVYKEALHNVVKHARADQVKAVLGCRGTTVTCLIQDNGVGFDISREREGHYGLRNMQRRVEALGGRVVLTSRCGRGTALTIELPLT